MGAWELTLLSWCCLIGFGNSGIPSAMHSGLVAISVPVAMIIVSVCDINVHRIVNGRILNTSSTLNREVEWCTMQPRVSASYDKIVCYSHLEFVCALHVLHSLVNGISSKNDAGNYKQGNASSDITIHRSLNDAQTIHRRDDEEPFRLS